MCFVRIVLCKILLKKIVLKMRKMSHQIVIPGHLSSQMMKLTKQ
jgi:hypothetical protein